MRILLVEDEVTLAKTIAVILKKNKYLVDTVYDGEEAIDYLEAEKYDLVILDIMLPKKNGFEVIETIRKEGINTPVLFLSALSQLEDKVKGLNLGGDDYLTKPFQIPELLARINALSRRSSSYISEVQEYNNVKLDKAKYEISYNNKSAVLSNKEMQLLSLLFTNPECVIETGTIMDQIWGWDTESDISVVWVYICNIRKKLQHIAAPIVIKAARGVGYKLEKIC